MIMINWYILFSFIVVTALLSDVRFIREDVLLVLLPTRQNEATDWTRHVMLLSICYVYHMYHSSTA